MAVLGQNITASPEEYAAFDTTSKAIETSSSNPALLNLDRYSQADIQDFAVGTFQLLAQKDSAHPREWLSLSRKGQEDAIAEMDSGEALATFDVMHNPIMEELASRHATDALAFANDVMINLAQIELKQQIAQFVATGFEDADDDSLPPAERRKKQAEQNMRNLADAMAEIHEERMEQQREKARKEWDAQMHNFGGQQRSGAWITDFYNNWWSDPDNQEKLRKKLKAEGKTDDEIDDTFKKIEERKRLWNLMRDCTNEEERKRLQEQYDSLGTPDVVGAEETAAKEKDRELEQNRARKEKRIEFSSNSSDLTERKLEYLIQEQPSNDVKTAYQAVPSEEGQPSKINQIDIKNIDLETTSGQFKVAANNIVIEENSPAPKAIQPAPDNTSRVAFM